MRSDKRVQARVTGPEWETIDPSVEAVEQAEGWVLLLMDAPMVELVTAARHGDGDGELAAVSVAQLTPRAALDLGRALMAYAFMAAPPVEECDQCREHA